MHETLQHYLTVMYEKSVKEADALDYDDYDDEDEPYMPESEFD